MEAKQPKSVGVALAEADYWHAYAWNARGERYAANVDQDAWKLFYERSKKAEGLLLASRPYASANPLWGSIYLKLAPGLEWSKDDHLKLYRRLIAEHHYFYANYFIMANYATPKWGGDWDLVDAIAREAEANTKDKEGAALYARVYWSVSGYGPEFDLFAETRVDWPHMKQGFEDMAKQFPHSAWNMNAYASFACMAGDAKAFRAARERIGDAVESRAWSRGPSLDLCEHRFPVRKAETAAPFGVLNITPALRR